MSARDGDPGAALPSAPDLPTIRTDLGDGWWLVRIPYDGGDSTHLEHEPTSMVVSIPPPYENVIAAFAVLGIKRKRVLLRRKPGPSRKVADGELGLAIFRLAIETGRVPTEEEVAAALGVEPRTIQRAHKGMPWRRFAATVAGRIAVKDPTPRDELETDPRPFGRSDQERT